MSDDTPDEPMTVTLHKDDQSDFSVEEGAFATVGISVENAIPKADLRELIEEWKNNPYDGRTSSVVEMCADELEALLDGENDER